MIIGLILAGVMKAKDMIRSAQAKSFASDFVLKWVGIVQSFHDKTGVVFTDSTEYGGNETNIDGLMDNVIPVQSGAAGAMEKNGEDLVEVLQKNGIDPCRLIKSDITGSTIDYCGGTDIFQRTVQGEYINEIAKVFFMKVDNSTGWGGAGAEFGDGTKINRKNVLIFSPVPVDVAKAIDKQIDGREDGEMGSVLRLSCFNCFANPTQFPIYLPWPTRFTVGWDEGTTQTTDGKVVHLVILLDE